MLAKGITAIVLATSTLGAPAGAASQAAQISQPTSYICWQECGIDLACAIWKALHCPHNIPE
jgi:hypothetical protein